MKLRLHRLTGLLLSFVLLFSVVVTAAAAEFDTYAVTLGIEMEETLNEGEVTIDLADGQGITAKDWAALKDYGKPFVMRYDTLYFRFDDNDINRTLGANSIKLSPVEIPDELEDLICEETGLDRDEFMLVLPASTGKLPATATIGICLTQDFINHNGYQNINIYGVDYIRYTRTENSSESSSESSRVNMSGYDIKGIGLYSSGNSAEKAYSPWITLRTNVSRLLLLTTKTIDNTQSISWNAADGSLSGNPQEASQVVSSSEDDANPNTGSLITLEGVFIFGAVALVAAGCFALRRSLVRKR